MTVTSLRPEAQRRPSMPHPPIAGYSQWRLAWRRLRQDRAAVTGAAVIAVMVALAAAAPGFAAVTGHGPARQFPGTGISVTGAPAGPGNAATTGGPLWPVTYQQGQVIELDPAGPLFTQIGAGSLRAFVQGQDDAGHQSLAN